MRDRYNKQLELLNQQMIEMGSLCEEIIRKTSRSLEEENPALAKNALPLEEQINEKEREIENLCFRLLLEQQPVASDLRKISAALKMITDLERIGDQAEDIAELADYVEEKASPNDISKIREIAEHASQMVTRSIDAYVKQDLDLARQVIQHDDIVDDLFSKLKKDIIGICKERPEDGEYSLDLMMIAKYYERVADHATNIGEWVEYSITGVHKGGQ
ncbi:MAG: phosphate signaling complex protein PhoU [Eubacteriales bacterium]|nr:phosphate signaling complex protein PhoU [Eubacteriales bacterium]